MEARANLIKYNGENIQRSYNLELITIGDILEINGRQFAVAEFKRGDYKIKVLRRDIEIIPIEVLSRKEVIYVGTYVFSDVSIEEGRLKETEMKKCGEGTREFDEYDRELRLLKLIKKQNPW